MIFVHRKHYTRLTSKVINRSFGKTTGLLSLHLVRFLLIHIIHIWYCYRSCGFQKILERMRAPVREAFSYGIRHWIRHIHCDSMSYDQIRVKTWETIPRIIPRIPQYGVWYSAECMHWNAKKSVANHFKNRLKLW